MNISNCMMPSGKQCDMKKKHNHENILAYGPKNIARTISILSPLLLFFVWFIVSLRKWVKPLYLPQPWRVLEAVFDIEPNIFLHLLHTTSLILIGLSIGTLLGFFVGLLLRHSFILRSALSPIIESWRPIPIVAMIPFFILWFGFSWIGKIILISFGTFLIIVVGVMNSIDNLNPIYLRIILSYGGDNLKFLRYGALKAIMPSMLAPIRIALAIAVTLAVVSEFMGATRGLGYLINVALSNFSPHTILLCAIILGLIGAFTDWVLRLIHSKITRWAKGAREAVQAKV
jgi:ABC-type nitrate/sulfonate/bicarbonate transport system permease component